MLDLTQVRNKPLVRLLIPYVTGIILGHNFPVYEKWFLYSLVLVFFLLLANFLPRFWYSSLLRPFDFKILLPLIICGYLNVLLISKTPYIPEEKMLWAGVVEQVSGDSKPYKKIVARIEPAQRNDTLKINSFLVQIVTPSDSMSQLINVADYIRFSAIIRRQKNLGNPNEFDYAGYLAGKRIFYTCYLKKQEIALIAHTNRFPFRLLAHNWRSRAIETIENYPFGEDEKSVAYALTLGFRDDLSDELKENYSNAGAVHVMAVSGLHVGILYLIFSFLFSPLGRYKSTRLLRLMVLLVVIWMYAVFTGFSASVIRASLMFSIYALGNSLSRKSDPFNSLALAAFVMLIANPLLFFDAGFQLSFGAVWGILYFQPRLEKLFAIRNRVLRYFYQLLTVSVSAQLGTLPLVLYYFHQFPSYFWLVNLLLIPLVFLVICAAMLFFLASVFGVGVDLVGYGFDFLLNLLNKWVFFVGNFPGAVIANIHLNLVKVLLLFLVIALIGLIFNKISYKSTLLLLTSVVLVLIIDVFAKYKILDSKEMVFYNAPKGTLISIHHSDSTMLIVDPLYGNSDKYNWVVGSDLIQRQSVKKLRIFQLQADSSIDKRNTNNHLLSTDDLNVFILNNKKLNANIQAEYLYVSSRELKPNKEFILSCKPEVLILNSSIPLYHRRKWIQISEALSVKVVDLGKTGAYFIRF